jgi:hypothetical protein
MKISPREYILGISTVIVMLYGAAAIIAKPKIDARREIKDLQMEAGQTIESYKALIAEKDKWGREFGEKRKLLPEQPVDKKMDVYWLMTMDQLASKHSVTIHKHQAMDEAKEGDVYELPIECSAWEGSLESITHFLFELQDEGAMLDIRQLAIKPKENGALRGSFTLYCAYTRAKQGGPAVVPPAAAPKP